jgi:rhodanese-related sulfurtransferase
LGAIPYNARFAELPRDRPLIVHCSGGYRSSIAASLLLRHGFAHVSEIAGGIGAWEAAHLPIETGTSAVPA